MTHSQESKCCPRCFGRQGTLAGGGIFCAQVKCPCHSKEKPEETATSGWEKEFEKFWKSWIDKGWSWTRGVLPEDPREHPKSALKDFIAKERTQAYSEGYEEGQKHAFGVDRARVKEEAKKEFADELRGRIEAVQIDPENEHTPYWQLGGARMKKNILALLPEQESK